MKLDWLLATPVAHRGLHDDIRPENSMPAFEAAMEKGYTIEIDVHLSSDGHIVVFHDDNLKRVCGVDKKVAKCTLKELKTMKLKGTDNTIPTFDEFLALVDGKAGILCEIKGLNPYDNSISKAVCERLKTYKGKIALQSFNYGAVRYCRRHSDLPTVDQQTLQAPFHRLRRERPRGQSLHSQGAQVHPGHNVDGQQPGEAGAREKIRGQHHLRGHRTSGGVGLYPLPQAPYALIVAAERDPHIIKSKTSASADVFCNNLISAKIQVI